MRIWWYLYSHTNETVSSDNNYSFPILEQITRSFLLLNVLLFLLCSSCFFKNSAEYSDRSIYLAFSLLSDFDKVKE